MLFYQLVTVGIERHVFDAWVPFLCACFRTEDLGIYSILAMNCVICKSF